jgi:hypothetical protein
MTSRSAPVQLRLILPAMERLDLTDDERDELLRLLRRHRGRPLSAVGACGISCRSWSRRLPAPELVSGAGAD